MASDYVYCHFKWTIGIKMHNWHVIGFWSGQIALLTVALLTSYCVLFTVC